MRNIIFRFLILGALALMACDNTPKPECTANKDCTKPKQACKDGKCADVGCTKDSDCQDGVTCGADNTCQEPPGCPFLPDGCCTDKDCKEGETCTGEDNKCVTPTKPCTKDDECKDPALPKCLAGKCEGVDVCTQNEDCKDPAKGECKEAKCVASAAAKIGEECDKVPCEGDLTCYARVGTPFCRKPCDPFNAVCIGGTVCALIGPGKGACLPRNNGKIEGESCVSNPCERNLFCVDWTSKICAKPCRPDKTDCSSTEVCYDLGDIHLCTPKPPECGPGRPCLDKWTCDDKQKLCFPPKCPLVPCQKDEICKAGSCTTPNCCDGDPCSTGNVCNHQSGACVSLEITIPFCTNCLSGGSCAQKSQRCITLTGSDDKLCADECTASKTCADPQMECIEQTDKRFFCIPLAKTCQRDRCDAVTCKDGEACLPVTKACVKIGLGLCQPCSDDLQCGGPTDKCIKKAGATEGHCAQDCSGCAQCPKDYTCSGNKQCIPTSGACK